MSANIVQQANELDDGDMWLRTLSGRCDEMKQVASALKDLEFSLRCFQCSRFLRAPVSVIPCRHTFCSECVRVKFTTDLNSTARKASCALCNAVVNTTGSDFSRCLEPNRISDTLVETFRHFRQPLLERLLEIDDGGDELPELVAAAQQGAAASELMTKGGSSSSHAAKSVLNSLHNIASAVNVTVPKLSPALSVQRPKLPRTIYKGKSKRQLVELCNTAGLLTVGDDVALQKRHKEYVTLYNSECDSLRPRSNQELLAIMCARDHERGRGQRDQRGGMDQTWYFSTCLEKLKQERKILGESNAPFWSSVRTGYADFDRDMEEGFAQLIRVYRETFPVKPREPWVDTIDYESHAALSTATAVPPPDRSNPLAKQLENPYASTARKPPFFAPSQSHISGSNVAQSTVASRAAASEGPSHVATTSSHCTAITRSDRDIAIAAHDTSVQAHRSHQQPTAMGSIGRERPLRDTIPEAPTAQSSFAVSHVHNSNMTEYSDLSRIKAPGAPDPVNAPANDGVAIPSSNLDADQVYGASKQVPRSYPPPRTSRSPDDHDLRIRAMILGAPSVKGFFAPKLQSTDSNATATLAKDHAPLPSTKGVCHRSEVPMSGLAAENAVHGTSQVQRPPQQPTTTGSPMDATKQENGAISVDVNESKRKADRESATFVGVSRKSPKMTFQSLENTTSNDAPRLLGPWVCGSCTFINQKNCSTLARCEMCDSKRIFQAQPTVCEVYEID